MTSDGFVAFYRSVQNIFIFKTSYLGPDLEEIWGQNVAGQILGKFSYSNLDFIS